jgi:predicted neuraminidase
MKYGVMSQARSYGFRLAFALLIVMPFRAEAMQPSVVLTEFVSMHPPTPQCHAGTLVETPKGLVAAWFGGKQERDPSVGIWLSRHLSGQWTNPREVANGKQPDGSRLPTWNPVLFRSATGRLMLFYKIGPDPQHWWGMLMTSDDDGASWSAPRRLPPGILGPIKNKPIQLVNGDILSPSSTEQGGWRVHIERSVDDGRTWVAGRDVSSHDIDAIQPSLLLKQDGAIEAVGRTRQGKLFWSQSRDAGQHWSPLRLLDVDNPNAGIDAVALADGRYLLVYNPASPGPQWWDGRGTLAVAISADGLHWKRVLTLEDKPGQEYSYPAVMQSRDGLVHVLYTWQRTRMRHVVIDPVRLGAATAVLPERVADRPIVPRELGLCACRRYP